MFWLEFWQIVRLVIFQELKNLIIKSPNHNLPVHSNKKIQSIPKIPFPWQNTLNYEVFDIFFDKCSEISKFCFSKYVKFKCWLEKMEQALPPDLPSHITSKDLCGYTLKLYSYLYVDDITMLKAWNYRIWNTWYTELRIVEYKISHWDIEILRVTTGRM